MQGTTGRSTPGAVLLRLALLVAVVGAPLAGCGGDDQRPAASSSDRASSDRASSDRASSDRASSDRASSDRASGIAGAPETAPVLPATGQPGVGGGAVEVTDVSRIVVLNGDLAEVVWALGLGDRVVATDTSATHPPAAAATTKIGYQRALHAEGILAQRPTVVLASQEAGPLEVLEQLDATGLPVVVVETGHDLDAPTDKIRAVAAALGVPNRGAALADEVGAAIDAVLDRAERVPAGDRPSMLTLYLRGANTQLIFGSEQGADAIAAAVGGRAALSVAETSPLTAESLVAAAPEVLVVTTSGLASVGGIDGLLRLPGVAATPAGRDRRVFAYDDQMLLGFGPRLGTALEALLDFVHPDR